MPKIILHSDPTNNGPVYCKTAGDKDGKPFEIEQLVPRDVEVVVAPETLQRLREATIVKPVKLGDGKTTHKEFPAHAVTVVSDD